MDIQNSVRPHLEGLHVAMIGASQYLYDEETRSLADAKCEEIAQCLSESTLVSFGVEYLGLGLEEKQIMGLVKGINSDPKCVAVMFFGHTFTLTGQWVRALRLLNKPVILLDSSTLDKAIEAMVWDDMNLHQLAHGNLELNAALLSAGLTPMYLMGDYTDVYIHRQLDWFGRIAMALVLSREAKILSWGPTMDGVRLTYADPFKFGDVFGPMVSPLQPAAIEKVMKEVNSGDITLLWHSWSQKYNVSECNLLGTSITEVGLVGNELCLELAMRRLCEKNNAIAVTTSFENLGNLNLPGAAMQDMMYDGYGFGPEGHFVVAYLVWLFKLLGAGTKYSGTTLAEDYVLQPPDMFIAGHMLELCPSTCISGSKPVLKLAPLNIGSREAVRLVFDIVLGDSTMTSVIYRNGAFRMVVGEVESIAPPRMPNMHVAKALLRVKNKGELAMYRRLWMEAMAPHHSALTQIPVWVQQEVARQLKIPCMVIGENTDLGSFQTQMATQFFMTNTPL